MFKQNIQICILSSVINPSSSYVRRALLRQRGVTSIEYALLSALITLVILGAISSTGTAVFDMWTNIATQVKAAIG